MKEDIAKITRIVEQVRSVYAKDLEQTKLNHQLRLAALDQRLKAHQEAYALWWKLMGVVHDKKSIGAVIEECQDWWVENNLYLDAEVRQAFRLAYHSASTYCQIYTELREADSIERQQREDVLSESWKSVNDAGEAIVKAVELPGLVEKEYKPASPQDGEG